MKQAKQCPNADVNLRTCACTYPSCEKKGQCCECIKFHRERNELPGGLFSPEQERTYDRSVEDFMSTKR